jgi:glycosyltransferase involved in cell wall biosynthesis
VDVVTRVQGANADSPLVVMVHPLAGMRGPARTLLDLAAYLTGRWEVLVAVPEGFVSGTVRNTMGEANVLAIPLSSSRAISWLRGSRALVAALRQQRRPVLIHANGLSALNLVAPAATLIKAPVFVHFHAYEMMFRSRLVLRAWNRFRFRMNFFPVSDFSRGLLEGTAIKPLVRGVIPNPVTCDTFKTSRNGPRRPFRIGFVGSKAPRKGLHVLVEVARLMRDEDVEWHLYGLDLPEDRNRYVNECIDRVTHLGLQDKFHWHGKVGNLPQAYANVDALLISSSQESFCRVALEGMASGLPIVASRIAGLSEIVWEGHSGLLFDPLSPEEGADHLRRIVHDVELRTGLAQGAVRAASRFDLPVIGRRLEHFYRELLENSDRPKRESPREAEAASGTGASR